MTGQPCSSPNAISAGASVTTRLIGHGAPRAVSRSRMIALSWACTRAAAPGRTSTPADSRSRNSPVGTCSWSKVITSQPAANARTVSGSV